MKSAKYLAVGALALVAASGPVWGQALPEGRVYAFHSKAQAGCPALDWHVVVGANAALNGMISWNEMKQMAHADGHVNMQARTFEMSAKEVGGQGRTATINGTVRTDGWLVANIKGPNVNCQGIAVPWFTPTAMGGQG
jgi:hypothetical protein